ncbi:YadA-like family protein [Veillonella sp.]|uniref:YadA-like family protein n=2 Tax=unclassified Veillonella TaxID=2630086 RepID=UPI0025EDC42C|nr:YadA-like family protein [Veillonella sp.]
MKLSDALAGLGRTNIAKWGGYTTTTSGAHGSIFIGNNAYAQKAGALALGISSNAANFLSMAIGTTAEATGDYAQAIGAAATAQGNGSIALGKQATVSDASKTADSAGAIAIGDAAKASNADAISIGRQTTVAGAQAIAIGQGAAIGATSNNGVAIGQGTTVSISGGIALGSGVTASKGTAAGYDPTTKAVTTKSGSTWNSGTGELAIGTNAATRQITYVAAGSADTDAANVAQLKAAQAAATTVVANGTNTTVSSTVNSTTGATTYAVNLNNSVDLTTSGQLKAGSTTINSTGINSNKLTVGSTTVDANGITTNGGVSITNTGINAGSKVVSNVQDGVANTDAVNVSQLNATKTSFSTALSTTNAALSTTNTALSTTNTNLTAAQNKITAAEGRITTVEGKVSTAENRLTAVEGVASNAATAAATADSKAVGAQKTADNAVSAASIADSKAVAAQSTANSAVSAASTADSKAVAAQSTANSAVSAASTVDSKAVAAQSTANSAVSTASTADSKAVAAQSTANSAVSAASTAQTTADAAKSTADTAVQSFTVGADSKNTATGIALTKNENRVDIVGANNNENIITKVDGKNIVVDLADSFKAQIKGLENAANGSGVEYKTKDGETVVKIGDKFYPAGTQVDKDGKPVDKDGKPVDPKTGINDSDIKVTIGDDTPRQIGDVASGLDGKAAEANTQPIGADDAKKAVNGENGTGGLLGKTGTDLNNVATIKDLQAVAQAGLDFEGNREGEVHRPISSKLTIKGNAATDATLVDGNIAVVANTDKTGFDIKLNKDINLTANGSVKAGETTINADGVATNKVAIAEGATIDNNGINMNGDAITGLKAGVADNDAVNVSQLNAAKAAATTKVAAGQNVTVESTVDSATQATTYTVNGKATTVSTPGTELVVTPGTGTAGKTDYSITLSDSFKAQIKGLENAANGSGVEYKTKDGETVVKIGDKFYPAGTQVDKDGKPVDKDGKPVDPKTDIQDSDIKVTIGDDTPRQIGDVASGLDGKAADANTQPIGADDAKKAVGGENGTGGLLGKTGTDLNNVATIKDLQAVAQAGLDFEGDREGEVHRPISSKLTIKGNAATDATLVDGNIAVVANTDKTGFDIKLNKDINLTADGSVVAGTTTINKDGVATNKVTSGTTTLDTSGVVAGATTINAAGVATNKVAIAEGATIDNNGINMNGDAITGLKAGEKATDAVNFQQLKDVEKKFSAAGGMTTVDEDGDKVVTVGDKQYKVDEKGNPVSADKGTQLVEVDGKYYNPSDVNSDGTLKDNAQPAESTANGSTSLSSDAPTSGLGLNKGSKTDANNNGNPTAPISAEDAKKVVGGENGTGGLLGANGTDLNKIVTVQDLQAVAQAGLDFEGDREGEVHRPISSKLTIKGNAATDATLVDGNIAVVANTDKTGFDIKLNKDINLTADGSIKAGTTTINAAGVATNKVAIAEGATIDNNGINMNGDAITGLKAGEKATDAVNFQQLKDVEKKFSAAGGMTTVDEDGDKVVTVGDKQYKVDENGNPVSADKGTKLIEVDGKYYNPSDVNEDGTLKDNAQPADSTANGSTSLSSDAPTSGLGLNKGSKTDANNNGNPTAPISAEDAKKVVGGENGTGGLLGANGTDLNKIVTVQDLQAVAQAGLNFTGDTADDEGNKVNVHRPLSNTLSVTGGVADEKSLTDNNIGVVANQDNGLTVKLNKDLTLPNGSVTTTVVDANGNETGRNVVNGTGTTTTATDKDGNILTNTSTAAGNTISDGKGNVNASTATQAEIKDTEGNINTSTAKENKLADNKGNSNTSNATSNTITDGKNTNTSTATENKLTDGAGKETVVNADGMTSKTADGKETSVKADGITTNGNFTATDKDGNKTTVDGNGITIAPAGDKDAVSLTKDGLDNGGNRLKNIGAAEKSGDAVTFDQFKEMERKFSAAGGMETVDKDGDKVVTIDDKVYKVDKDGNPVDKDGNKLKEVDGKYYNPKDVTDDGKLKSADAEPAESTANGGTSLSSNAGASGLGLTKATDADAAKGVEETGPISAANAKKAIAGEDGNSGLLGAKGKDLNKVVTLQDLQAAAQAGLDFGGDRGKDVHRPLGNKLTIKGDVAVDAKLTDGNIGVVGNEESHSLDIKLNKDIDLGKDGSFKLGDTVTLNGKDGLSIKGDDGNSAVYGGNGMILKDKDGNTNTLTPKDSTLTDANGNTNSSTATGNTMTDNQGNTNSSTAKGDTITDNQGNSNSSTATGNTITDNKGNSNASTSTGNTITDDKGNSNTSTSTGNTITDGKGNSNSSTIGGNTIKDDKGNETNVNPGGVSTKDKDGNSTSMNPGGVATTDKDGNSTSMNPGGVTTKDKDGNSTSMNPGGVEITDKDGNTAKVGPDGISLTDKDGNTYVTINQNGLSGKEGAPVDFKDGLSVPGALTVAPATKDANGNTIAPVIDANGNTIAPVIDANGNRIQNVGNGILPTDAANVGQLQNMRNEMKNHSNNVGSMTAALAALNPLPYIGGEKGQIMAGVGVYENKQAVALGYAYTPNSDQQYTLGVSYGEGGKTMANMGATFRIGSGDGATTLAEHVKAQTSKEYEAKLADVKAQSDAKISDLQSQVEELRQLLLAMKQG